jgi:glycine cleavage system H protein
MTGEATPPPDRRYTAEHVWIKADGDHFVAGITGFAQEQLGDVVYIELPSVGQRIEAGQPFGVIESVKTASDLYAPVSGEVVEVHGELSTAPERVNQDPYEGGWLIKVRADAAAEVDRLLSAAEYGEQTGL